MRLFYIDTSSSFLYTGIVENDKLISEATSELKGEMSKYTDFKIEEVFAKSTLKPTDIDKIIVVGGPGSYTGIRIGMTFAKIYAYSLKKDITVITSLEAMVYSTDKDNYLVPVIDARRGFVYAGVYKNKQNVLKNQYIKLTKLLDYLKKIDGKISFIIYKSDKDTLEKELRDYEIITYQCDILKIVQQSKDKEAINPHLVEPIYLKLTEAEENLRNINHDN